VKKRNLLLLMLIQLLLAACTHVEPWERGNLAKPEMAFDFDPMQHTYRSHVYNSREAASGGDSAEGGGCGCY
jgi:hypothetical protein